MKNRLGHIYFPVNYSEILRGDTHMTSTLTRVDGVGKAKMRCYRKCGGGGLASVLDVQSLFILFKKIGFAP